MLKSSPLIPAGLLLPGPIDAFGRVEDGGLTIVARSAFIAEDLVTNAHEASGKCHVGWLIESFGASDFIQLDWDPTEDTIHHQGLLMVSSRVTVLLYYVPHDKFRSRLVGTVPATTMEILDPSKRTRSGLVLCPVGETGFYFRVGVFMLFPGYAVTED